ncbi:MAG: hypothetical protein ACTSQS_16505 [Promethearchaeota archaeon]
MIFTRGEELEGVEPAMSGTERIGGQKWGYIQITSPEDLETCKSVLKRSFELIKEAIANNEQTGYWALIEK